jgi:hypothetical protein
MGRGCSKPIGFCFEPPLKKKKKLFFEIPWQAGPSLLCLEESSYSRGDTVGNGEEGMLGDPWLTRLAFPVPSPGFLGTPALNLWFKSSQKIISKPTPWGWWSGS